MVLEKIAIQFSSLSGKAIPEGKYIYRFLLEIMKTFVFGV